MRGAWLLLLAAAAAARACGPSRGGGLRRNPRKLTALVVHQHVPNTYEQHESAAGKSEGKITKDDPRFQDLVPNYNPNIVFLDEEGTGFDRLMTQKCREKLNALAISVMNQWPDVFLRVEEGWEEDVTAQQELLHYEGRAVDVTTSDRDSSKYGMLARLAVEAGFDWVHYESNKRIHCSVKSESSQAGPTAGCFPASAVVRIEGRGPTPMSELRVGERVLAWDEAAGRAVYSDVLGFLDRDEAAAGEFVRLTLAGNRSVTATPAHLLLLAGGGARWAGAVRPGARLLTPGGAARVLAAARVRRRGLYAPLTAAGTLLVDGALASCYAAVRQPRLAALALAPLRAWLRLAGDAPRVGVHPYVRALYALGRALLPADMFYRPQEEIAQ